ncbi:hypothetical protein, partial [Candidatus Symbiopectobacterium sp. NZEC135]|uniref:hypothetical protein n=1 Tax=Candidatus Symbiopectobacterium sp. NZEC135 TaxID=2820471 RepID=UPI002227BE83
MLVIAYQKYVYLRYTDILCRICVFEGKTKLKIFMGAIPFTYTRDPFAFSRALRRAASFLISLLAHHQVPLPQQIWYFFPASAAQ